MQMTIKKLVEILQSDMTDDESLGRDLAMAMAKDRMSYNDAYEKLHEIKHILYHAEKCLSKAAFKELSRDNRQIDPSHISEMENY
ncbi:TPA: hypothetical protein ACMD15_003407 [Vibrio cholerae]